MSDEAAFLAALKANPADDTARLVYADWLDEHGEPQKAEYLRLIAKLAIENENIAEHPSVPRVSTLAKDLPADWRSASAGRFMLVLYDYVDIVRAIKAIRELTGQGLGEAKAASEALPAKIFPQRLFEDVLAGFEKLRAAGTTVRIHPFEQKDLPDLARYQILADLRLHPNVHGWERFTQTPAEATTAFAEFLRAAGVDEPEATALREELVVIADNLNPTQANNRSAEFRQLLPAPLIDPDWSIEIYVY